MLAATPYMQPGGAVAGGTLAATRLATLPFVSAEERRTLESCALSRRSMKTGAELVREGEPSDMLYILNDGWACQYLTTRDGRRQISMLLVPGDMCEAGMLTSPASQYSVRMLTPGTVMSLPRTRLQSLAATHKGIAGALAWLASLETSMLARRILCLGRLSARERLAHLLCETAVRVGLTAAKGEISFDLPLTQEHLADSLGLTPVHVNRTIQQLRAERLIETVRRRLTIHDVALLRQVGEFRPDYLGTSAPADRGRFGDVMSIGL